MNLWEVFVNSLADLPEDQELTLSVRTLNPGIHKYTYTPVRAKVSPAPERYPDHLQVRFGRGQLYQQPFSIKILEKLSVIPEKYR